MNDNNPAKGIVIGCALGALFWAAFAYAVITTSHSKRAIGPRDRVYVCELHAPCERVRS